MSQNLIDILLGTLAGIGFLTILLFGIGSLSKAGKKKPVNTLYLKRYPDGTRAYRLGLRINLESLEPGDKFEVTVQEEQPTETDILVYKNVKEE